MPGLKMRESFRPFAPRARIQGQRNILLWTTLFRSSLRLPGYVFRLILPS